MFSISADSFSKFTRIIYPRIHRSDGRFTHDFDQAHFGKSEVRHPRLICSLKNRVDGLNSSATTPGTTNSPFSNRIPSPLCVPCSKSLVTGSSREANSAAISSMRLTISKLPKALQSCSASTSQRDLGIKKQLKSANFREFFTNTSP